MVQPPKTVELHTMHKLAEKKTKKIYKLFKRTKLKYYKN